jgi:hypothetical protein
MLRRLVAACVLTAATVSAGCGRAVDLKTTVKAADTTGGWFDAGIVEGRNKLIPSVTFRVQKSTDQSLRPLSLNVVFKRLPPKAGAGVPAAAPGEEDWEEVYLQSVDFAGNQTAPLTVRPTHGYTGDPPQSRAEMLKNSQFRDIRVHVFAKHSSSQWVEIGQYDIPRQLLTQ